MIIYAILSLEFHINTFKYCNTKVYLGRLHPRRRSASRVSREFSPLHFYRIMSRFLSGMDILCPCRYIFIGPCFSSDDAHCIGDAYTVVLNTSQYLKHMRAKNENGEYTEQVLILKGIYWKRMHGKAKSKKSLLFVIC